MGQQLSKRRLRRLEGRSPEEQKKFLSDWGKSFKIEAVSSANRNVKKGDHLMVYRYGYTHHLICTSVGGDKITAMEYGLDLKFDRTLKETLELLVDLEKLGKVHETSYTLGQLEEIEVQKIVWPRRLRRFNANKCVDRARSREGERKYNCLTNNCEHFVVWCICGLKVSLQVESWYFWAKGIVSSLCARGRTCGLGSFLLKVLSNVSDELAVGVLPISPQYSALVLGFAVASIIEAGLCYAEIKEAFDQRDSGEIATDELLKARILEIVAKVASRFVLGVAGSAVGLAVGGPLGSLVGGAIGTILGHNFPNFVTWLKTEIQ